MSWFLFMDESGHDHKNTPYEVYGGIALHESQIDMFVQSWQKAEKEAFGLPLSQVGIEIKGSRILERTRFKGVGSKPRMLASERQRHCRELLLNLQTLPSGIQAYRQACLYMAERVFIALKQHGAVLFASAIPRGVKKPREFLYEHYLRKDLVFLFERFYYFLKEKNENGFLVMDSSQSKLEERLVKQITRYFTNTYTGRIRAKYIDPYPSFVDSTTEIPVQAADVCLYAVNWGFRLPKRMDSWRREEVGALCGRHLFDLQFRGQTEEGIKTYGIFPVQNPYAKGLLGEEK